MTDGQPEPRRPWAIVTGAAHGMEAAVAGWLAADGFDLVLVDGPALRLFGVVGYPLGTAEELASTVGDCREFGRQVHAVPGDVRDEDAWARAVALVPAGRLRAAVAVAGVIGTDKPAYEFCRAELATDLDNDFRGVANVARVGLPHLRSGPTGLGRFVAVVSTAGETGLPRLAGYVSAKHAALGYIRSLAADLDPYGIMANAVLPGSTRTVILSRKPRVYGLRDLEDFSPYQRLNRLIEPAEVAAAVSWLCGPGAGEVTGATIRVDGGFV